MPTLGLASAVSRVFNMCSWHDFKFVKTVAPLLDVSTPCCAPPRACHHRSEGEGEGEGGGTAAGGIRLTVPSSGHSHSSKTGLQLSSRLGAATLERR